MKKTCLGCGVLLQTANENKVGYVPKDVFENQPDRLLCKRCFELKHYNQNNHYELDSQSYQQSLQYLLTHPGLIVYVVDLFDLDYTVIEAIQDRYQTKRILIVVNKVDLFLDSLNKNRLYRYLQNLMKEKNNLYLDLLLISSFSASDIVLLLERIKKYKKDENVYFIGMTNVGKSSIINKIISFYTKQKDLITVHKTMNTTLGNVFIPFDKKTYFVDTPGIMNPDHLHYFLSKQTIDFIIPQKYIKPKIYHLNPGQTLFVTGLLQIDFLQGEKCSFVIHVKNELPIHRSKLELAPAFFEKHQQDILMVPTAEDLQLLGNRTSRTEEISVTQKQDFSIAGFGFFTVIGTGTIRITYFEKMKIFVRKAIF